MRILHTDQLDSAHLSSRDKLFLYNGLDCLICREIYDEIKDDLDETTAVTYQFMRALQGPILEMQLRGCLIDRGAKKRMIALLSEQLVHVEKILNHYAKETWGQPLNARSPVQKAAYLYDFAKCREIRKFDFKKNESKRTTDRAAIEKLSVKYPRLQPVTLCILKIMDLSKLLGTLRSGIDRDGYFRASFNIAGTETGRLSSKKNAFGTASNFQNITERLREIFTAPEGPIPNRLSYNIPEEFR